MGARSVPSSAHRHAGTRWWAPHPKGMLLFQDHLLVGFDFIVHGIRCQIQVAGRPSHKSIDNMHFAKLHGIPKDSSITCTLRNCTESRRGSKTPLKNVVSK